MSIIISIVALLQAASQLPPEEVVGAEARSLAQPYWDCVTEQTVRFEKSKESASDVAMAAMTSCDVFRKEIWAAVTVKFIMDRQADPNARDPKEAEEIVTKLEDSLRNFARLRVVQIRVGE